MEIAKLYLRPAGMFSNVNEIIQQLYLAEKGGYKFVVDWSSSCYMDPEREEDPWNYYFESCFPDLQAGNTELRHLINGVPVACSKDNIITPREFDGDCVPLLLPRDRELPHRFIERYIALKPRVEKHISDLVQNYFVGYVIGLHIRGPGRTDGGAPGLRSRFPCKHGVPFEQYFRFVDERLVSHPDAKIFACSDSSFVIQEIMRRYGKRVILYAAIRSPFGEMHAGHPANGGTRYPKYKLGEDVIIDAYALSQTDYFIHGNSNIVNFVLCNNPLLVHKYVYSA